MLSEAWRKIDGGDAIMATLAATPEIAIGRGRLAGIGSDLRAVINRPVRILVVLDPGLKATAARATVEHSLGEARMTPVVFDRLAGEPHAHHIDDGADLARANRAEAVIGIGGGTALDVAKMIAAISIDDPGADHYQLCANPFPPVPLPLIQVPTTAGTGSEATITAVHTNRAGKKVWCWGHELRAAKVILDADLMTTLPPHLVAATGLDALVHALEAATNRNATPYSRLYGHEAIRLVAASLPTAVADADPARIAAAREQMLWASCLAGMAINNCGTAIAHTIAHAVGTLGKVHHGRAAALGLRASLPWNITDNRDAYADIAVALGGPRDADALPALVATLIDRVGLDTALAKDLPGITPERLAAEMAAPEHAAMRTSNAKPSTDADLLSLARAVLAG